MPTNQAYGAAPTASGPPPSNTGVTTLTYTLTEPRLDWLQVTVPGSLRSLVKGLEHGLMAEARMLPRGRYGYDRGYELRAEDRTVAQVFGDARDRQAPHVVATGSDAPALEAFLRLRDDLVPTYSRVDVAVDTDQPGAYERLTAAAVPLAKRHGMKPPTDMGPIDSPEGHTVYVGAKTSEARMRIYDKSAESPGEYPDGTVRTELQVRPGNPARKAAAAGMSATDLLGWTKWSREFYAAQFDFTGAVPPPRQARKGDLDSWAEWVATSQANRWAELVERDGPHEAMALILGLVNEHLGIDRDWYA